MHGRLNRAIRYFFSVSVLLVGCGRVSFPVLTSGPLPESLKLNIQWDTPPRVQLRQVGASTLVSLQGRGAGDFFPETPGLGERIDWRKKGKIEWRAPALEGCELSQLDFFRSSSRSFELQAWGWDTADHRNCQRLFAQVASVHLKVHGLSVWGQAPLAQLEIACFSKEATKVRDHQKTDRGGS